MTSPKPTYLWTAKKAHFKGHESCPKCRSRDNLGRYSDGSAWCFGCHYWEPPERTITNVRQAESVIPDSNIRLVNDLPLEPKRWLKKYGLTNEEIAAHFLWDNERQRLVVGITRADKLVFWQGRRFGEDGPKYLSWGAIPWGEPLTFGNVGPIVFVEDAVSAIKVGHSAIGVPLFGSHLPANALKWAQEQRKPIGLWLDPDKRRESLKQALKATANGVRVYTLTSDKDPKEHTYEFIAGKVGELSKLGLASDPKAGSGDQ